MYAQGLQRFGGGGLGGRFGGFGGALGGRGMMGWR
jgi:hypothetical protein